MKNVNVELTIEELLLLAALASDQLFRREFIDPKIPGYKSDPVEVALGKDLVVRLRAIAREASGPASAPATKRTPSPLSRSANRLTDAV